MSSRPKRSRFSALLMLALFGIVLLFGAHLTGNIPKTEKSLFEGASQNASQLISMGSCGPWKQVNTNGFGLPSEFDPFNHPIKPITEKPFQGEEGFEVLVFDGQLYLGMEADNLFGARLWRTREGVVAPQTQLDWEEVAADQDGWPFGVIDTAQADHIDSLAEFQGQIYASLANRSNNPQGTLVFRSPNGDPGTWEEALNLVGPGFGKTQNENFKDMQVFDGYLCGGTWNETDGAEVWCTPEGKHWEQKNLSGFGDPRNIIIWSGHVFGNQLYFGVEFRSDEGGFSQGRLYRTKSLNETPATWEEVFRTPEGTSWGNILGDLNGYLYISMPTPDGIVIYRSPNGDAGSWQVASLPGFDNDRMNWTVLADGASIYQGDLYAGVSNGQSKFTLWRTSGQASDTNSSILAWEKIPTGEITDPNKIYAQLVSFNGALYAWTSNPVNGQQVWRTICGTLSTNENANGN
jgi:hypothetical protein